MDIRQQVRRETRGRNAGPVQVKVASLFLIGLLSACAPKPASQANPPAAAAAAQKVVLSSNLDQIQNQYAADAASAHNKYDKVAVQFTAVADEVEPPQGQGLVIGFTTTQHPQAIRAVFTTAAAGAHAAVKPGDLVMARCDKVLEVAGKPQLLDCVFR